MQQKEIVEKIYFMVNEKQEEKEGDYVLFLRFFDPMSGGVVLEDTTLEVLREKAKKVDPYLESYIKDVDEEIEEFLESENLLSTEKGELFYYCHLYRIAFDEAYNRIDLPPAPKETVDLFEYIEKEYKKLSASNYLN